MYYTEACLNLTFEALHKLMFNETIRLEVLAVLSNWLNTSQGSFISLISLAALIQHIFSNRVQPVSFQHLLSAHISLACKNTASSKNQEDPSGLMV